LPKQYLAANHIAFGLLAIITRKALRAAFIKALRTALRMAKLPL